jgi:predicted nucleotidyltransferase
LKRLKRYYRGRKRIERKAMKDKIEETKNIIKKEIVNIITEFGLELDKIILFGSRARGDFNVLSDWDILIILKSEVSFDVEMKLSKKIRERLAENLIPCDILIRTPKDIERLKNYVHSVTKTALKEGVIL